MPNLTVTSIEDVKNLPVGTVLATVEGWIATKEETTLNQCWRVKSLWREGYYPPSRLFEHGPLRIVSLPEAPTPPASETSTEPDLVKAMAREIYRMEWKADLYATPYGPVVSKYERLARSMLDSPVVAQIKKESARDALLNAAELAFPALANEVSGHTSTHSVRTWLRSLARKEN